MQISFIMNTRNATQYMIKKNQSSLKAKFVISLIMVILKVVAKQLHNYHVFVIDSTCPFYFWNAFSFTFHQYLVLVF